MTGLAGCKRNRRYRIFIVCLLAGLAASGCGAGTDDRPCQSELRCIRYGISADIPMLDPHVADSAEAGIVFRQIFDTLVYRDPDTHEFVPGLATDWQISTDGLQYSFNLRPDISFHDGTRFNASAVVANIERIYDSGIPVSYARELLGPLTQYEILGEYSIRFTLVSAYPAFLDSLAQPFLGMASPAALDEYNSLRHQFHLSGTGPFRMVEYLPGERIVLRRFEDYLVKPTIYPPAPEPAIDRIDFLVTSAENLDALAQLDELFDIIDNVAPPQAQNLAGNSRIQLVPAEIPGTAVHFMFNTRRSHVDRREVRLALLLATNRIAIVDQIYFNFSPVAWAPLTESTGYSHTGYINRYNFDAGSAQELLASVGYVDSDGDGILESEGEPLSLTIVVPPWGSLPAVATMLQRQWRSVGVELKIEPVPGAGQLQSFIRSGQYDLIPVERFGIDAQVLNHVFLDGGDYTASHAPDPNLNSLLVSAMQEMDPALRRSQVYAVQARIMDEILILPIRDVVRLTAARAELVNLRFDAYGFYPLLYSVGFRSE